MVIDFLNRYDLDCDLILNNGTQYCNKTKTFNDIYPMDNHSFQKIATILEERGYLLSIHTNQGKYSLKMQNHSGTTCSDFKIIASVFKGNLYQRKLLQQRMVI